MRNNYNKNKDSGQESRGRNRSASKSGRASTSKRGKSVPFKSKEESRTGKPTPFKSRNESSKGKPGKNKTSFKKEYSGKSGSTIRQRSKPTEENKAFSSEMRLNRFIANAGICSRREADTYITSGVVSINGKTITELGTKVNPGDLVRFDGRKIIAEKKVYLLLNKPKDFVSTTDDPHAEKTVMELINNACEERIYPVGRLDRNTTGLLLFTNDGDLSKKLMHPSHNMKKIYQVTLNKALTKEDLLQIAEGVELEDGKIAADAISFIKADDRSEIGIEIHSGKNRVVRRIFEHLGYRVKKLDRVYFAGLTKKNLPRGKWRFLSGKEVNFLKMQ